jgi:hypothetical protein
MIDRRSLQYKPTSIGFAYQEFETAFEHRRTSTKPGGWKILSLAWPRLPRPEGSKALAVPSHHGVRLDDHHCPKTAVPEAVEQNPEGSIEPHEAGFSSRPALKDFQLMTKSDDLDLQISSPSEA